MLNKKGKLLISVSLLATVLFSGCSKTVNVKTYQNTVEEKYVVSKLFLESYAELKSGGIIKELGDNKNEKYRTNLIVEENEDGTVSISNPSNDKLAKTELFFNMNKRYTWAGMYQINVKEYEFITGETYSIFDVDKSTDFIAKKYKLALEKCNYDEICALTWMETGYKSLTLGTPEQKRVQKMIDRFETIKNLNYKKQKEQEIEEQYKEQKELISN